MTENFVQDAVSATYARIFKKAVNMDSPKATLIFKEDDKSAEIPFELFMTAFAQVCMDMVKRSEQEALYNDLEAIAAQNIKVEEEEGE